MNTMNTWNIISDMGKLVVIVDGEAKITDLEQWQSLYDQLDTNARHHAREIIARKAEVKLAKA